MRKFIFFLFAFSFAFIANAQVVLTDANNDTTIVVVKPAKGTDLTVTLKNNGGTPYEWKQKDTNDKVLSFDKKEERSDYKPKEGEPPMTGTPYFTDFKYKFTGNMGDAELKFDLVSFSGDVARSVKYTVKVSDKAAKKPKKKKK